MRDLKSPGWIWTKGVMFLLLGIGAGGLLLAEAPSWKVLLFLLVAIWAFCRAYYFAFYVIEHYVDPQFKFSGLIVFARYLLRNERKN